MVAGAVSLGALALQATSCSSGGGGGGGGSADVVAQPAASTNLAFGFDPGMPLTEAITDYDVTGGLLPNGGGPGRAVAFVAFVTAAEADDGDGRGRALDRSVPAPTDEPGTDDVFVAAVAADLVDTRTFVYSLAGKMRHPRCVTCHMMNVDAAFPGRAGPSTAFATGAPHAGGDPPLGTTSADDCEACHFDGWRAPPAASDLRRNTAAELAARAAAAIAGPASPADEHVRWALESGELPDGHVADDDHDGVLEPEDSDGVPRLIAGGLAGFARDVDGWEAGGFAFDSKEAVRDVVLMSRASGVASAGDAASFSPSVLYVRNPDFVDGVSDRDTVPVGHVHVAFASDATNLAGGEGGGFTDVFRSTAAVFHRSDGEVDIVYDDLAQRLVSESATDGGAAAGDSTDPDLAGPEGNLVAFASTARDLIRPANLAAGPDVYLRDLMGGTTLVSRAFASANPQHTGGNAPSAHPELTADGVAIAFESDATDLVPSDRNGRRDVFYGVAPLFVLERASVANDGSEGVGGDSRHASVYAFPGGVDVRVAFESTKENLVDDDSRLADSNVFLRDSRGAGSTLQLNRIVAPPRAGGSTARGVPGDAFRPSLSPDGNAVLFETDDAHLDFVRPGDHNRAKDVLLVDLLQLDARGLVLPYALSVTPDGGRANGASLAPRFGAFDTPAEAYPLGMALFATEATNLTNPDVAVDADADGVPDHARLVTMFLREGASVVAGFDAEPAKQGAGLPVSFVDRSSGEPTDFAWDFGDGGTSKEQHPTHVYAFPGVYTVTLDASGELGADSSVRTDLVRVLGPVQARFTGTKDASAAPPQQPAVGVPNTAPLRGAIETGASTLVMRFDASSSTECPDEYDWTLVEVDESSGLPLGTPTSFSSASTAEVSLDARGVYRVTLDAVGLGGAGQASQPVEVWERVRAAFRATTPTSGPAPLTVSFVSESTGDVEAHAWSFGTAESNPAFQFDAGVHDVSLRVTGRGLDEDVSVPLRITAFGDVTAAFAPMTLHEVRASAAVVNFSNLSASATGRKLYYRWEFGNGIVLASDSENPLTGAQLRQSFPVSPEDVTTYAPRLVASADAPAPTSCAGASGSDCAEATGELTFFPQLVVDASVSVASPADPGRVQLQGLVTGDGAGTSPRYEWYRNDANGAPPSVLISTDLAPEVVFPGPGNYLVMLRVSTNGPGGGRQVVDSASRGVTVFATFTDVFATLSEHCVDCHSGPPSCADNGGFVLGPTRRTAYDALVGVPATCGPGCIGSTGLERVEPFSPVNSLLYRKLEASPVCGGQMPPEGPLGVDEQKEIQFWILGGALDN